MENDNIILELLKSSPLETRLKVLNEMYFINLLSKLGYRKDKMWLSEESDKLNKLLELASELTNFQLEEIKQWEQDGRP